MISLAGLAVFSGLSLNLFLQFAVGTEGSAADSLHRNNAARIIPRAQLGILFVSVVFLWVFFSSALPAAWRGFSEYFLFFPLSALVCMGLELLCERILSRIFPKMFPQKAPQLTGIKKVFPAVSAYDGLVPAALFITSFAAERFADAVVLAFFFTLGNLSAMLVLNEIRRRSTLEWVPRHLRGSPLVLISMGLLSLISASAAWICFRVLEAF